MKIVATLLWKGCFREKEKIGYSGEWVRKLRNMVKRNLQEEHRFVCLSNINIDDIDVIPLKNNFPGFWGAIEIFRKGLFNPNDCVFYTGLDTLILQDINPFFTYCDNDICLLDALAGSGKQPYTKEKNGRLFIRRYQNSVTVFTPSKCHGIYEEFVKQPKKYMGKYVGDQDFLNYYLVKNRIKVGIFPGNWARKLRKTINLRKVNKLRSKDIGNLKVIYNANIKGNLRKHKWIEEIWK